MKAKKYIVAALAVILVSGITGSIVWAQTSSTQVTACAKSNGSLYLIGSLFSRQSCASGEQEISWPTLAGTPNELHLYDGNNQDLGKIINVLSSADPSASFNISGPEILYSLFDNLLGTVFNIYVRGDGLVAEYRVSSLAGSDPFTILHTSTDCSGTPYARSLPPLNTLVSIGDTNPRYFLGVTTTDQLFAAQSYISSGGSCVTASTTDTFRPVQEVSLPSLVPPLRIVETQF